MHSAIFLARGVRKTGVQDSLAKPTGVRPEVWHPQVFGADLACCVGALCEVRPAVSGSPGHAEKSWMWA